MNTVYQTEHAGQAATGREASPDELQAAFRAGWRTAANWMNRDDLLADIGSPAYLKDMADALAPMLNAQAEVCGPKRCCKNCAHKDKSSCEEPCAGCTVRWYSGVSDRWEFACGPKPSHSEAA